MSQFANYAATPKMGAGSTITADTSLTAPTNANVGVIWADVGLGSRIDNLDITSLGTSVAGLHRMFLCEGDVGKVLSGITSSTTTATATTSTPHGLVTGDLVTIRGAFPVEYNVSSVAVTVTGANTFTFVIVSTGSLPAITVGAYSTTHANAVYHLLNEDPVIAMTASATSPAFNYHRSSAVNSDWLPLVIPAGWSLRTTVSVTQTQALKTIARGGAF